MEHGISENLIYRFKKALILTYQGKMKIFTRKKEYIEEENSNFENLKLDFFNDLFKLIYVLYFIIFLTFLIHLIRSRCRLYSKINDTELFSFLSYKIGYILSYHNKNNLNK